MQDGAGVILSKLCLLPRFILYWMALWPSVGKEVFRWLFTCDVFIFSVVLVVRVPFPFDVWGRVWNSVVSVPDHCHFIYFGRAIASGRLHE